jgi:hypothetical protein
MGPPEERSTPTSNDPEEHLVAITPVPQFTVRWTEPLGALRTRQHELSMNLVGESGSSPLRGHITADTQDNFFSVPAGGRRGETRTVRDAAGAAVIQDLWKQVKRDRIEQWIPRAPEDAGRLDRRDIELVVTRGAGKVETFRTDLRDAPQPVLDLLAAAAKIHTDVRLGS